MITTLTPEQIDELKAKHEDLYQVETHQGMVYFKHPPRMEFKRAAAKAQDKDPMVRMNAQETLCKVCVVHPGPEELNKLFERYEAISKPIADMISQVAEGDERSRVGK